MDMFAFGGLMFLLASDTKPFSGLTENNVFFTYKKGQSVHPNWAMQTLTQGDWRELPRACMAHNPFDRPRIRDIFACVEDL